MSNAAEAGSVHTAKPTAGIASSRLHALDAVRAFALLLGVIFHATLSFAPLAREHMVAPIDDRSGTLATVALILPIHMFRLQLFFLMAGFFAHLVIQRRGLRAFCRDRAQRILLPLVLGWLIVMPMISAAWFWGVTHRTVPMSRLFPALSLHVFPLSYLWFLYFLLVFYVLVLLARAAMLRLDRSQQVARAMDVFMFRAFQNGWLGLACLCLPFCLLVLFAGADWAVSAGMPPPSVSLIPAKLPLVGYGLAFGLGWMLSRNRGVLDFWRSRWPLHLAVAGAASAVCLWIFFTSNAHFEPESSPVKHVMFTVCYILGSWCWTLGLTGFALRFLASESPVRRYIADASYWVYLSHYPIVLALQDALADVRGPALLKFGLILVVTFTLCFVSYHYLVRSTLLGQVLNGRRYPRRKLLWNPLGSVKVS